MSVLQVVGATIAVSATAAIGTATITTATTSVFQIDNRDASVFAYVNVFTTNNATANSFNHPTIAGQTGYSLTIPPSQSRILAGNFNVTGGGQTLYVNYVTSANSATVHITPVSVQRTITL
jgi:hypothetical protein